MPTMVYEAALGVASVATAVLLFSRYDESNVRWAACAMGIGGLGMMVIAFHRWLKSDTH